MRIIDDKLYSELIKVLAEDPKVKVFQQLVLAPKAEATDKPGEIAAEKSEVKNDIRKD